MKCDSNSAINSVIVTAITVFLLILPGVASAEDALSESNEKTTTVQATIQEGDQQALFLDLLNRVIEIKTSAGNKNELQSLLENDPICQDITTGLDLTVNSDGEAFQTCKATPLICLSLNDCEYMCIGFFGFQSMELTSGECFSALFCMADRDCGATCYRIF